MAVSHAGGASEINLVADAINDTYTLTFWFNAVAVDPSDPAQPVVLLDESEGTTVRLSFDAGGFIFYFAGTSDSPVESPTPGEWVFCSIVMRPDPDNPGGESQAEFRWATNCETPFSADRTVLLGAEQTSQPPTTNARMGWSGNTGDRYAGAGFQMARQWDRELTEDQLLAEKLSATAVLETDLWSDNPMADADDTSDASGNGNTVGFYLVNTTASAELCNTVNFDCDCDDETSHETLAQLRSRMMVRLGYAAQASNPPPGMAALLNDFLQSAQRFLYQKYKPLRTERFYTWTMEPGVRLYGIGSNEEGCTKRLNVYKVTWVGVEDLNGAWLPLVEGIPPEFYTAVSRNGLPGRYEIRQCIEVFPPPAEAYSLRIKGHFGLEAFTADADKTTIDSELVFLWALANAKNHYGQPDADDIATQANTYLKTLVAGSHNTARYVPGTQQLAAVPAPVFLPLSGD